MSMWRACVLICGVLTISAAARTGLCQAGGGSTEQPQKTGVQESPAGGARRFSINGRLYEAPTHKSQFHDYLRDTYGLPAFGRTTIRSVYAEAVGKPDGWGQDFPEFAQRFGSNAAITAINGNVRYAAETIFREDMRYIPCHGCSAKRKLMNSLLAEVTARHDSDGHRFFTLTPAVADFSGPIVANAFWYPNRDPLQGVIGTRTVAAIRVGQHVFQEFVWERRHKDRRIEDAEPLRHGPGAPALQPRGAAIPNAPPAGAGAAHPE